MVKLHFPANRSDSSLSSNSCSEVDEPTDYYPHSSNTCDYFERCNDGSGRRTVRTHLLSAPTWSTGESIGYALHSSVWWLRRLSVSRTADACQVVDFIKTHDLWDVESRTASATISYSALVRLGIQHQFWWISKKQIQNLASGLSAIHRLGVEQPQDLEDIVKAALFGITPLLPKGANK